MFVVVGTVVVVAIIRRHKGKPMVVWVEEKQLEQGKETPTGWRWNLTPKWRWGYRNLNLTGG
jgi:hypothetical protein